MKYKKVEFAPRVGVEQHEDIAEDFIPSIFSNSMKSERQDSSDMSQSFIPKETIWG